ncbi:MAG: hypothetical protein AMXMBFR47_00930 [Planctomycetota bacterium]
MNTSHLLRPLAAALFVGLFALLSSGCTPSRTSGRLYNGPYTGEHLDRVAFPIGGMGAGMICLEGTGAISHVSVRNRMDFFNEPAAFAAICIKRPEGNLAKVLEGPVPTWKVFGDRRTANGAPGTTYGLPRFDDASFLARIPFGVVTLRDDEVPLDVEITGWSPFIPGHADEASLPIGALEYRFRNRSRQPVEAVFSYNTKNFMAAGGNDRIEAMPNGFILTQPGSTQHPENEGAFAIFTDNDATVVDHSWFRGGWWDAMTLAWRNVAEGRLVANPPQRQPAPGASLFTPLTLAPGEERTIRLMVAWYVPRTTLSSGSDATGPAIGKAPSRGTAKGQQRVTGFLGRGLVNTYDSPAGDAATGALTSPEFEIDRAFIQFLLGGGNHPETTCMQLLVGDQIVRTETGRDTETLSLRTWDVGEFKGRKARIRIVDRETGPWGHINVDHIALVDQRFAEGADLARIESDHKSDARVLADFEAADWAGWTIEGPAPNPDVCAGACCPTEPFYRPWYSCAFKNIGEVTDYWRKNYDWLREESGLFRDAFYDTTLPPEVIEAVAANLTILKSPTVLRECNGRLWSWEGCNDDSGCCAGSCTHVWNYAQALPHLFPDLERTLRATEFCDSQNAAGHQTFRAALPIRPVDHAFHAAADGQLGGIMKVYRDWRILGDAAWLREIWPQVRQSLDYCIATWDPRARGVLEEPHHNTYDIEYWGPDGHCSSFYLGALAAAIQMGESLGDDVARYRDLLAKGRAFLETKLYNGDYFFQLVQTDGLNAKFTPIDASSSGPGYDAMIAALNTQGPKYQYGAGCLSDGVLGFWMARVCGLDGEIVDSAKVRRNLESIYRFNLRQDLSDHANPQRPTYAVGREGGLLLCTWPRGGAPALPFVYSDEVWTGIEYQAASHMMIAGLVDEGLEVVRLARDRYDGRVRNPFNEYECGHWYARAMSSYALLQGLTGVRYDAIEKTLYIDSRVGDFRSFLSTATGFGTVGLRGGRPFITVRHGTVDVERFNVSGRIVPLAAE